jgi:hypothetical protein
MANKRHLVIFSIQKLGNSYPRDYQNFWKIVKGHEGSVWT